MYTWSRTNEILPRRNAGLANGRTTRRLSRKKPRGRRKAGGSLEHPRANRERVRHAGKGRPAVLALPHPPLGRPGWRDKGRPGDREGRGIRRSPLPDGRPAWGSRSPGGRCLDWGLVPTAIHLLFHAVAPSFCLPQPGHPAGAEDRESLASKVDMVKLRPFSEELVRRLPDAAHRLHVPRYFTYLVFEMIAVAARPNSVLCAFCRITVRLPP